MHFFIISHVILGFLAGNSGFVIRIGNREPGFQPKWVLVSPVSYVFEKICYLAALLAIPTTFFEYGLLWTFATFGELCIGALLCGLITHWPLRWFLHSVGPFVSIYILGALWGFWYIPI